MTCATAPSSAAARLAQLPAHPAIWRGGDLARTLLASVSTGFAGLDAELPGGGWPVGALTELLPAHEGIGELRILGAALAALSARGAKLAWIAPPYLPYAPALAAAGIEAERLVIVRTRSEKDTLWAAEQALASNACLAVLAWLGRARFQDLRRLQLAAESGQALALLFRPPQCEREPSPAALRLALSTSDGGLAVRIVKRRGAPFAGRVILPAMAVAQRKKAVLHVVDRNPSPAVAPGMPVERVASA
jgi:cell division inhibitor SulA/protein ImuA